MKCVSWLSFFACALLSCVPALADEAVLFNRDVRPVLSANCFQCHGNDDSHREADLRLDTAEGVLHAFGDMNLSDNEGWQRITSTDDDFRMPPPAAHRELKPAEIDLLKRWIEQGAKWEGHWAFLPPQQPAPPQITNPWIRNPLDAFILAEIERHGLKPSPEADKERLLRRVTFDLTGLPPTIAEIDAFLADGSPEAYEKVVDRLLTSKSYGERMALRWMDAARYGDSSVFHADGPRDMWPWRDWVINAYNDNVPFDRFTIEQLAGDLLPNATLDQQVATGFNRNNATTDEGGAIAEEYRVEYAVDRVKTTSMVWLGLSMECAQCHDHKYDPISQREYYRFFAYFNQAADPGMQTRKGNQQPIANIPDKAAQAKAAELQAQLPAIEVQLADRKEASQSAFEQWLSEVEKSTDAAAALPGNMLAHFPLDETEGAAVAEAVQPDRQGKIAGKATWGEGKIAGAFVSDATNYVDAGDIANFERTDSFSYGCWVKPKGGGNGAAIARMDDGNGHRGYDLFIVGGKVAVHIINSWPGNAIKVNTKAALKPNEWNHVLMTYDGSSKAAGVKIYFNGAEQPWTIEQDRLSATIRTDKPVYLGRRNPGAPFQGSIDDVRFYARTLTAVEAKALAGEDPLAPLLATPAAERTPQQVEQLKTFFLNNQDQPYQELTKKIAALKAQIAAADKPISTVMVMKDTPKPRMTYILDRGNYASPKKDQSVEPGVPTLLGALPENAPGNRLGLAQWLVQPEHPLTARVAVNRYWQMLFGAGLVDTMADFGSQGAWPSHPALLDYLAVDFVESGWNVKRMLKQMVMSATYRQTSRTTPEQLQIDPKNRWLGRGPRFRLPAEFIRDNALAASGLLVNQVGGPSVKPYQPPGLWIEVSISGARFSVDKGENLFRRSMYTYWKRSSPAPAMTLFDAPTREKCVIARSRTNTPLQALVTLNDPQFLEAARALAQRALQQQGSIQEQIIYAYRLTTGVTPKASVVALLVAAYEEELAVFQKDPERAKKIISVGDSPRDEKLDAAQHAALSIVAGILLNLDETLTRG